MTVIEQEGWGEAITLYWSSHLSISIPSNSQSWKRHLKIFIILYYKIKDEYSIIYLLTHKNILKILFSKKKVTFSPAFLHTILWPPEFPKSLISSPCLEVIMGSDKALDIWEGSKLSPLVTDPMNYIIYLPLCTPPSFPILKSTWGESKCSLCAELDG